MSESKTDIQELNVHKHIGSFVIASANVPIKNHYLTLVLRDGRPFDMAISSTIEQALAAQDTYEQAAVHFDTTVQPVLDMIQKMLDGGQSKSTDWN